MSIAPLPQTQTEPSSRDTALDVFRGILCISVVLIHVFGAMMTLSVQGSNAWNWQLLATNLSGTPAFSQSRAYHVPPEKHSAFSGRGGVLLGDVPDLPLDFNKNVGEIENLTPCFRAINATSPIP